MLTHDILKILAGDLIFTTGENLLLVLMVESQGDLRGILLVLTWGTNLNI